MANFNKVFLMGNLTKDPELRCTQSGTAVCTFRIAINRKYRQNEDIKEETCFVAIVVWGKQGENCNQYLNKGKSVFVEGRLKLNAWKGEDGQQKSKLEVVGTNVQFLSSGKGKNEGKNPDDKEEKASDSNLPF